MRPIKAKGAPFRTRLTANRIRLLFVLTAAILVDLALVRFLARLVLLILLLLIWSSFVLHGGNTSFQVADYAAIMAEHGDFIHKMPLFSCKMLYGKIIIFLVLTNADFFDRLI